MLDPDAGVMPESDIDAAFTRSSSIAIIIRASFGHHPGNIRNSPEAGAGASSFDHSTGLVSRTALRYRGGV
jgi:hypothetical protein